MEAARRVTQEMIRAADAFTSGGLRFFVDGTEVPAGEVAGYDIDAGTLDHIPSPPRGTPGGELIRHTVEGDIRVVVKPLAEWHIFKDGVTNAEIAENRRRLRR